MDITHFKKPWNHAVIENFFTDELLHYTTILASKSIKKYGPVPIKDQILSDYFQTSFKSKSKKHILEFNLMEPKTEYPIHDEAVWKKLSVVVYIKPEIGNGTYLFDKNQKIAKQVEWKINRAFIFKGVPKLTWHSYANTKDVPRLTVNYFEM